MSDKSEELTDLEHALSDALQQRDAEVPVDLEVPVLTVRSTPRPRGRDNKGSGRRGG
jgi:hypothetical protein